jgi:hypothetical protein
MVLHVPQDQPYIEMQGFSRKGSDPWPEAGWVCLPFAVEEPQFRLGRLGSVIDPAKDIVRAANFEMFCLDSGMTIAGKDGRGVGLCAVDAPLVSIGRPGAFRFSREFGTRKPTVFVNLFNNIWGTNFQQWETLPMESFCIRIWSTSDSNDEKNLITPAWEARTPLQAAYFDGPPGKLPPAQAGLELSRKGVLVTAFGPNPDGEGLLLRLWEQAGADGPVRVRLPDGLKQAKIQPCDLRGRPLGDPIPNRDGAFDVSLTHFAPVSLLLDGGKK